MSSGAECRFIEAKNNTWTYWLQDWPYGDNPDGRTHGPFPTFGKAYRHLHDNHQNPGGHNTECQPEGEHRHEWVNGEIQVQTGWQVQITVESLGPDATKEQVIARIQNLPLDHGAFRMWPSYGFREGTQCDSCGKVKEGA